MNLKEIQKLAIKFNKNMYFKAMCIPVVTLLIFAVLTLLPDVFSNITNRIISGFISDNFVFTIIRCTLLSVYGLLVYAFFCTIRTSEYAWYSGSLTRKKNRFRRLIFWYKPKYSVKAFGLNLSLCFLKLFWNIVFLTPAGLVVASTVLIAFNGGVEIYLLAALLCGAVMLLLCGLVFRFIIIQRYFLAPVILTQNPSNGVFQTIKQSKNLSEGQLLKIVRFELLFIPYWLSCILIFPIFFVYPHYKQSRTIIANALML